MLSYEFMALVVLRVLLFYPRQNVIQPLLHDSNSGRRRNLFDLLHVDITSVKKFQGFCIEICRILVVETGGMPNPQREGLGDWGFELTQAGSCFKGVQTRGSSPIDILDSQSCGRLLPSLCHKNTFGYLFCFVGGSVF